MNQLKDVETIQTPDRIDTYEHNVTRSIVYVNDPSLDIRNTIDHSDGGGWFGLRRLWSEDGVYGRHPP
jgi:hypothetical protein